MQKSDDDSFNKREGPNPLSDRLTLLVLAMVVMCYALLFLTHLLTQQPLHLVNLLQGSGADFNDFWKAAQLLQLHSSPYGWERFVTPPLGAYLTMPLLSFSFTTAVTFFFMLNTLCLIGALAVSCRALLPERDQILLPALILLAALSYPVHFLLERGNIDLLVCLLTVVGLACGASSALAAGILLGLAVNLKIYPLLLLLPLWAWGYRRFAITAAIATVAISLIDLPLTTEYLTQRLAERSASFDLNSLHASTENISLPGVILFCVDQLVPGSASAHWRLLGTVAAAVWLALLCAMLYVDRRILQLSCGVKSHPRKLAGILLYLPFMIALPLQVYQYQLIYLLLLLPALDLIRRDHPSQELSPAERLIACAIAMALAPVIMARSVLSMEQITWLPGFALAALLVIIPVSRVQELRRLKSEKA